MHKQFMQYLLQCGTIQKIATLYTTDHSPSASLSGLYVWRPPSSPFCSLCVNFIDGTQLLNPKSQIHPPLAAFMIQCRGLDVGMSAAIYPTSLRLSFASYSLIPYVVMSHKKVACNGCRCHPITENWYISRPPSLLLHWPV